MTKPRFFVGEKSPKVRQLTLDPSVNPDDDSDSAMWRHVKYDNAIRKSQAHRTFLENGIQQLIELVGPIQKHSDYHYSFDLAGSRLNYWPSTQKWRWQDRSYNGTPTDLIGFTRKRMEKHHA